MSAEPRRRHGRHARWLAVVLALLLVAAACGDDGDDEATDTTDGGSGEEASGELTPIKLQLQWYAQSQFAGYYAAVEKGFYEEEGLDVEIMEGAVEIVPQQVLGAGQADFAIAWVPKALVSREEGIDIVDIAQVFQRSGTLQVSWKEDDITTPEDLAGTTVGNWGFGNELELFAGIVGAGLDLDSDVEIVQQNFDMQALLDRQIDSAQAMTYNEFGILLQTEDPETGELYSPDQFNTINWNDAGTGMLQDAIWANADWLAEEGNDDIAKRFVKASLKGWIYCRDNVAECTEIVVANGAALDALHMEYMMNEINDLIWPSPDGIGMVDDALWAQTVDVATVAGFLTAEPDEGAYTNDYVTEALAELEEEGLDVKGEDFEKVETDLSAAGG